jgi:hypothetical protein
LVATSPPSPRPLVPPTDTTPTRSRNSMIRSRNTTAVLVATHSPLRRAYCRNHCDEPVPVVSPAATHGRGWLGVPRLLPRGESAGSVTRLLGPVA